MEAIPVKCTKRLLILHVCVRMTSADIGPKGTELRTRPTKWSFMIVYAK